MSSENQEQASGEVESVFKRGEQSKEQPCPETPLIVGILDASVKNGVLLLTVSTKTVLPQYQLKETQVIRTHADFEWLHENLSDNPDYSGIIIPACPVKPDFTVSRDSISAYTEDEDPESLEYIKMKEELEREYLAFFKKAVACHESFLFLLSDNPSLRLDACSIEFLTSAESIKSKKGAMSKIKGMMKTVKKNVDENITIAFSSIREVDPFFETQSTYVSKMILALKNVLSKADSMTSSHKRLSNVLIRISLFYPVLALSESTPLQRALSELGDYFDKSRKLESRLSTDEDLKFSDPHRYQLANTEACRDMLLRRVKFEVNKENSLKAFTKAKQKNEGVQAAEENYNQHVKKADEVSAIAKTEIPREISKKLESLRNNLTSYTQLQIYHYKNLIKETTTLIQHVEQ